MSLDWKRQKDDCGSCQAKKENARCFKDLVNDISRQLEENARFVKDLVTDLSRQLEVNEKVKGQQVHISFGDDNLQLIDLFEEDDCLIPFPYRDSVNDLQLSAIFDNINEDVQPEPKRSSFLRKSLAWDSAFFTSAGLLDPEELFALNKGFKKTHLDKKDDKRSEDATKTDGSQSNALLQNSKRTRSGGLPKSTAFTTEKNHRSYESSSSASSKNLSERKANLKGIKLTNSPSSVLHFPLSSSPASSDDGWLSESLSSTTITHQSPIPVLDFHSQNSKEKKFISQNATIKSSGLRMPSPRIGFFDMVPGSMQVHFRFGGQLKPDGEIPKAISKMSLDRKNDHGSFQAHEENVCGFEDQVNDLSKQLEVIDVERDVVQVKGHRIYEVLKRGYVTTMSLVARLASLRQCNETIILA